MSQFSSRSLYLFPALAFTLTACGDNEGVDLDPPETIQFAAKINGEPFACGTTYQVGSPARSYVGADFRFYVHDLALVPADGGAEVPVTLVVNDHQTAEGIALLDFEDAATGCQQGSTAVYTTLAITGVPGGEYDGVRFKVGVPFAANHLDFDNLSNPPMNEVGMFWNWRGGYKFAKIEGNVADLGGNFNLHLGSTECASPDPTAPPAEACGAPNIMDVVLDGFDPYASTIVADIGAVLATSDVGVNTAMTAPGCMSFPGDPECMPIFPRLGLTYETAPAAAQQLFAVE